MQFLVIISALVVISLAEMDPKMPEYTLACSKEFDIDLSVFQKPEGIEKIKDDQKFKCFMKCVMTKTGFVSETGEFQREAVKNKAGKKPLDDKVMKEIEECVAEQKQDDMCERVSEISGCIYEEIEDKP